MIREGRALCLQCGRSGEVAWESLDPRHPWMVCRWTDREGAHGHGVTLGTRDQAESDSIQVQKRERRLALLHARGAHEDKPTRLCVLCEAERPHRAHLRARYSDPKCERCRAAQARAAESQPGTDDPGRPAGADAVQEGR